MREYNDYLRTLSRKLSHELRTPIAVIQTSLENLEQSGEAQARQQMSTSTRAREGLLRLNSILTAMSEANRLEESIRGNSPRQLDLVPLLREVFEAYRRYLSRASNWPWNWPDGQRLDYRGTRTGGTGAGQTAGKCGVVLPGRWPDYSCGWPAAAEQWELSVSNEGPLLPAELQERLFDPMVSLRRSESGGVHLGLGLHIVRLIVDFHRGGVKAENLPDGRRGLRDHEFSRDHPGA